MKRTEFAAPRCPGSLKDGFSSYCPAILRNMFQGKQVFHVLSEMPSGQHWERARMHENYYDNQTAYRLKQVKNVLVPDKDGDFVLKTVIPGNSQLRFHLEQPANEHLCLQLASQVFGLTTLPNALIFFPDGQPAIICRYYPIMNTFINMHTLNTRLNEKAKPIRNYYDLVTVAEKSAAATLLVKERLFSIIVYSWLIANGLAHAKNIGLIKTMDDDYTTAPLFQIMCTRLHELGPELALTGGLFESDKNTSEFRENGCYTRNEFIAFGNRIGLFPMRIEKLLNRFVATKEKAGQLINRAFLPEEAKAVIRFNFLERMARLK